MNLFQGLNSLGVECTTGLIINNLWFLIINNDNLVTWEASATTIYHHEMDTPYIL